MNRKKILLSILCSIIVLIAIWLVFPTWTAPIKGENSISELVDVQINGANHTLMIRGENKENPILLIVHGGPSCSEIPYAAKYQEKVEESFTIVHYDQRGSGKSYEFGADYSHLNSNDLVTDLLTLTDYLTQRFDKEKVILMGHSYGTYLGIKAISQAPEKFIAYVGVGQVGNSLVSELDTYNYCLEQAKKQNNSDDIEILTNLYDSIVTQNEMVPRDIVRNYGGAARLIDDNTDYITGFLFGTEYNLLDTIRFFRGISITQEQLVTEPIDDEFLEEHSKLEVPVLFVMGKYDYMTSANAAQQYFDNIESPYKEFITFENSAHYPQFEEEEAFSTVMQEFIYRIQ